eukprot:31532-Pelagococcus_subviridis.AAC.4
MMTYDGRTSYCPLGTSCRSAFIVTATFIYSPPRSNRIGTSSPTYRACKMDTIASRCPRNTHEPSLASLIPSTSSTTSPARRTPSAELPCSTCVIITPESSSFILRCTPSDGSVGGFPSSLDFKNRLITGAGTMCPWFSTLEPAYP